MTEHENTDTGGPLGPAEGIGRSIFCAVIVWLCLFMVVGLVCVMDRVI
jgi:hypothetical protein